MSRLTQATKVISINLGILLGGIVSAELIFGGWFQDNKYDLLNIPRRANDHFDVSQIYERAEPINYRRDKYGIRGTYDDLADIDVVVLGGSTTNERYVDDRETWVEQLNQKFQAQSPPITIVNMGLDGQTVIGHIRSLDLWVSDIDGLRPKFILAYIGINDIFVKPDEAPSTYDLMIVTDKARTVRQYIMNKSALYIAFRKIRGHFRARSARLVDETVQRVTGYRWITVPDAMRDEDLTRALSAYRDRLSVFADRIRALDAEPIFITQVFNQMRVVEGQLQIAPLKPGSGDADYLTERAQHLHAFNKETQRVCDTKLVTCIDLAASIQFNPEDMYDWVHTTPSGSLKIAEFLFPRLSPLLNAK